MPHIPALWYFDTSVTWWFCRVKLVVMPPRFAYQQYLWNIAIQPTVGCYNSWANLRCSGCSPLGENLLWNSSITPHEIEIHFDCSLCECNDPRPNFMGVVPAGYLSRDLRHPKRDGKQSRLDTLAVHALMTAQCKIVSKKQHGGVRLNVTLAVINFGIKSTQIQSSQARIESQSNPKDE